MSEQDYLKITQKWVEEVVIGLNLCPFASRPYRSGKVRFAVSKATRVEDLTSVLLQELLQLVNKGADEIATTILIHPHVLQDFEEYLSFLDFAEDLLAEAGLEGIIQIASFHPDYRFEGEPPEAPGHYTNRSPFPMLHFLREEMVEAAIAEYGPTQEIPQRNIELMNEMGVDTLEQLLKSLNHS